jgi:hypothetical protein
MGTSGSEEARIRMTEALSRKVCMHAIFRTCRILGFLWFLVVMPLGCGRDDSGPTTSLVRDSAGIRIVELTETPQASDLTRWEIGPEPSLEIGVREGDQAYLFSGIVGTATLSDGRLAVLEGRTASKELRFFSADGTHQSTSGGDGEGPGEFRSPAELVRLPGDTLVVRDGTVSFPAVDLFNVNGSFLRRIQPIPDLIPLSAPDGDIPPEVIHAGSLLSDGSVLIRTFFTSVETDPPPGLFRESYGLLRVRRSRTQVMVDSIGLFSGIEFFTTNVGQGLFPYRTPFGPTPIYGSSQDRIYVVESFSGEVKGFDYEGDLREIFRPSIPASVILEEDYEREKERSINFDPSYDNRPIVERLFREIPHRTEGPAVGGLTVDLDGNLWLELYSPREGLGRKWIVLAPDGSPRARVQGPARFTPFEIGSDFLLGVWTDEMEIPYVRRYPLRK